MKSGNNQPSLYSATVIYQLTCVCKPEMLLQVLSTFNLCGNLKWAEYRKEAQKLDSPELIILRPRQTDFMFFRLISGQDRPGRQAKKEYQYEYVKLSRSL